MANDVIDFDKADKYSFVKKVNFDIQCEYLFNSPLHSDFVDPKQWKVYTLENGPKGLLVIPRIFTRQSSEKWFHKLLYTIPNKYTSQLKSNIALPCDEERETSNLRWITFGYHHNWDTKVYDEHKDDIPEDIVELCRCVCSVLQLHFVAEAGIINYYTNKSTLSPHVDHSEINHNAPLLSFSFGSAAIFLIGGRERYSSPIVPIYLHNSDLLIMSEESRLSFHAIPKVFANNNDYSGKKITRINLNIRQVY
ncbi:alpha-ketoglutarate-dependent dioxygenase abh1-like protein [Dinothrombium tinctorium]|uniref:Alpha-ketoglutarate-dependent dioxygenase abh1-like protein n=1 Tax=Dinothrombium tinctorium TaxID=1965070 RepID=A0A443RK08_9ACAR|nr:alpha-ketoglutarate-dependent dioxygenase abh1-like protein [Dinothrombium tinctorium]